MTWYSEQIKGSNFEKLRSRFALGFTAGVIAFSALVFFFAEQPRKFVKRFEELENDPRFANLKLPAERRSEELALIAKVTKEQRDKFIAEAEEKRRTIGVEL